MLGFVVYRKSILQQKLPWVNKTPPPKICQGVGVFAFKLEHIGGACDVNTSANQGLDFLMIDSINRN